VRRVDDGRAAVAGEPRDELPEPLALPRVQRRRRLVEQQHGRLAEQPDGDVDALAVAARQRPDRVAGAIHQVGLRQHPLDPPVHFRDLLQPREQAQVLAHRQLRVDRRLLRHPADLAAVERHPSGRRPQRAREDLQQRRLAGAVRSDDRQQLAGRRAERDVLERAPRAVGLRQRLRAQRLRCIGP
jgi:hypothetical protein